MSNSKNVEALTRLIGICTGYGGKYNPGSPNLRVESLSELLAQARSVVRQVSISKTGYESATSAREVMFAEIRQLTSRILAELKSSGVSPQTVAYAAAMVRKIKGRVKAEKPEAISTTEVTPLATVNRPRVNGSDYESVVYHFEKLIATLEAEPKYAPGVEALQMAVLRQKVQEMRAANQALVNAASTLTVARDARNALLYNNAGSLYKTALAVKQQIIATFGYTSEASLAANRVKLVNHKNR